MLPFPKRNATSDEVELGDDDLVLVEELRPLTPAEIYARDAELAQTVQRAPRRNTAPPGSRRVLDQDVEEDVADQCLASIAAAASHDREPYSSSQIRASLAGALPSTPLPSSSLGSSSRLPSVHPPPCAFVRRSSPVLPAAAPSSHAALTRSSARLPSEPSGASVAPVSMTQRPIEPTVIVVRERPKAAWIIAAAALGALGAMVATRLFAPTDGDRRPVAAAAAEAPIALPLPAAVVLPSLAAVVPSGAAVVAAPSASSSAPASAAAPAIMLFGDDQGVAIEYVRPPAPSAAPRAAAAAAATATATLTPTRAPEPARRRALSPEQQLAEAQLKASMR